ncbi:uncharacterized protein LOC114965394 isoform X2 [Acropora millepora]|uniref:uncharacterized protein LOC114965394 isoform X2 n=1 Tax=Acropora millepora TaxID=45264 RepID=UPI001CF2F788|nr:uncharacterized protein LOC114965394 isoform X2 [Acropora millepora]
MTKLFFSRQRSPGKEPLRPLLARNLKSQLVNGYNSFKSNPNNMWEGATSGLEEKNSDVKVKGRFPSETEKKKFAVLHDDFSSSSAFESSPVQHRLENQKNTTKTIHFELKVENPGGEEEEDGCSQEEVNVSHHDLLINAVIKSNNARGASSGAEGSSVQESQGVSNHGDLLSSAGIDDSGASSAPRDKEDDQKPWPPAERKNVPTENADHTRNEEVDHDGDVIMRSDDRAAKKPLTVEQGKEPTKHVDDTCIKDCDGDVVMKVDEPWPPAERKNVPTENVDDTCNEKVDHDGDVIMRGDDRAAKQQQQQQMQQQQPQQMQQQQMQQYLLRLQQPTTTSLQPQSSGCIFHHQNDALWFFPFEISQSTFQGRLSSNACTFIAVLMAILFHANNNATANNSNEPSFAQVWLDILCRAIEAGNSEHDRVTGRRPIKFSVHHAIKHLKGRICEAEVEAPLDVSFIYETSQEEQSCLSFNLERLSDEDSNIAAFVIVNHMTLCLVARDKKLYLLDSHCHYPYGAMVGVGDMSRRESFLATVKQTLSLPYNLCSVTFVKFMLPRSRARSSID